MFSKEFLKELFQRHNETHPFPSTSEIQKLFTKIVLSLFPEQTQKRVKSLEDLELYWAGIENGLESLLYSIKEQCPGEVPALTKAFLNKIPEIYHLLCTDIQAMVDGDPAATTDFEVVRTYPGFYALAFYRLAHGLHELKIPIIPRILTEYAHSKTGIDIHPGAKIGKHFFMDHGTGIVIGETCEIGERVKIYQGVTLGALSVDKSMASTKRHPTIEDGVVIYSGATILGGETIVGANSIIGGNVWLTKSVPAQTKIYHQENVKVINE
ncbi:serine acetyltransferase [Sandaracinomonas limnophila]|uniref:Serine acetyltransferase n=1 Tax=Sandaracinomonas limnophila TaxID=1862386 RepID=A0A437PUS6_9BACT|nr:serine O-acetyltransferase EpsC [Sandaracinomonas limnophila]RVU26013.1 serine acetyltransferase [Sandaracinomonas limnophila]